MKKASRRVRIGVRKDEQKKLELETHFVGLPDPQQFLDVSLLNFEHLFRARTVRLSHGDGTTDCERVREWDQSGRQLVKEGVGRERREEEQKRRLTDADDRVSIGHQTKVVCIKNENRESACTS